MVDLHAIEGGGGEVSSPELACGEVIDDRFEIHARIGSGVTGSVYKAFDSTLDRFVAIKVLEPSRAEAAAHEAQILARIRHRNVVAIHDYGFTPRFRYLVLELLVGRDLRRWLAEQPQRDEILARFLEAGRGMAAAHEAGLVHRDLKPSNVILTHEGRAVVIDFGLARNLDTLDGEEPDHQGSSSGSLAYLAPEHFAREVGDQRCDQFAFCVLLWEALSGKNPFGGDDPISRYQSIARGPGPLEAEVPAHVVRSLRRGLSLAPDDRFATMGELLDSIEHSPSAPRRRRRPLLSAMLVAATFALGWGIAPDPLIEHAVSGEPFNLKQSVAFILLDSANAKLASGDTVAAKDTFDAATNLVLQLEEASPPYCRFAWEIEGFADRLLLAGDLPRGRVLYTRARKFARDCDLPRESIENLDSKIRSSREAFLASKRAAEHSSSAPAPVQPAEPTPPSTPTP